MGTDNLEYNSGFSLSLTLHIQVVTMSLILLCIPQVSLHSSDLTVLIICCLRVCNSFLIYLPVTSFVVNVLPHSASSNFFHKSARIIF